MAEVPENERRRIMAFAEELQADPRSLVFIPLAEALNRVGDYAEAARVARLGLNHHPNSVAGRLALAVAESNRNNFRDALEQIKAALIVDQDNPKSLALMGSLLLQKGLAGRAEPFFAQAVRLDPQRAEYQEGLKEARERAAREAKVDLPVVRREDVPDASPWSEGETEFAGKVGEESTVFDAALRAALGEPIGGTRVHEHDVDEPTAHAARPKESPSRPKMGGSAADYSKLIQLAEPVPRVPLAMEPSEEPTVDGVTRRQLEGARQESPRGRPGPEDLEATPVAALAETPPAPRPKTPPAPPPAPEATPVEALASAPVAPPPAPAEPKPADEPKRPPKREKKDAAPADSPGPAAPKPGTVVVDDAIWALFQGQPAAAAGRPPPPDEARRRPDRVVKSSAWLLRAAEWTLALLLFVGAAVGVTRLASVGGAREPSERLRGVREDLERGGLAGLLAAEESLEAMVSAAERAEPGALASLAEVRARIYDEFGRSPATREAAVAALDRLGIEGEGVVGAVVARAILSTRAADREALIALGAVRPSASLWVRIARARPTPGEAIGDLLAARRLEPARRETLLELARAYARAGAREEALAAYDELLELRKDDLEGLLERYVLGLSLGKEPPAELPARLFGLVREEHRDVAKDEAGRVALAFIAGDLLRGDVEAALEELGRSQGAFLDRPAYQLTVGAVGLGLGREELARRAFERAAELDPEDPEPRRWQARLDFARRARLLEPPSGKRLAGLRLPLVELELDPTRFEQLVVRPRADVFPEDAYARVTGADPATLADVNLETLARRATLAGRPAAALELLDPSGRVEASPALRFERGRALLVAGRFGDARAAFERAEAGHPEPALVRLARGLALLGSREAIAAIDLFERIEASGVDAVDGLLGRGLARAERGDPRGGRELLLRALELAPGDPRLLTALGRVEHELGLAVEALGRYRVARRERPELVAGLTRGDPRGPIDLYYLGRVLLEDGPAERGIELLSAAVRTDRAPSDARFFLGQALVKKGGRARGEGRAHLERYRRLEPRGPYADLAARLLRGR